MTRQRNPDDINAVPFRKIDRCTLEDGRVDKVGGGEGKQLIGVLCEPPESSQPPG
jgi:hypothetical protein